MAGSFRGPEDDTGIEFAAAVVVLGQHFAGVTFQAEVRIEFAARRLLHVDHIGFAGSEIEGVNLLAGLGLRGFI